MDKLFLLNPHFRDAALADDNVYYCPSCAAIEGVLYYYPHLREQLDVTYVSFPKPRKQIVDLLGDAYQGCPVLIMDSSRQDRKAFSFTKEANGYSFLNSTTDIMNYLAKAYAIGLPHP